MVNNKSVRFRLDTGADATVLPADTFYHMFNGPISPANQLLCGPNGVHLDVVGRFNARLQWQDRHVTLPIYVLRGIHQPLLGRDAIEALGIIKRIDALSSSSSSTGLQQQYADLFTGLGCMDGEYEIRLKPDAQPFAI
ncbi:MAG TPA: hypothetical protein VLA51_00730, partial [Paracoccaceae bacterium]|nr:hypothetical protein [Paracoccaceae bacterium]